MSDENDPEEPTFEVEYNKRDIVWQKNMQRNCFEPLCDNQLGKDSEIGRVELKGLLCSSKRGFCLFAKLFPSANLLHAICKDISYRYQNSNP